MLNDTRVPPERHIILPSKEEPSSNIWTIEKEKIRNLVIFLATEKFQYSKLISREFPTHFAEQTFERYRIIYVWKILQGFVPNFGISFTENERTGKKVVIPQIKKTNGYLQHLRENSLSVHGGKLFNILPKEIRNLEKCSVEHFKENLDNYLSNIPDEPNIPGSEFTPRAIDMFTGRASNSLIDQIRMYKLDRTKSGAKRLPG